MITRAIDHIELVQKLEITAQQINLWNREFFASAETVFNKGRHSIKT